MPNYIPISRYMLAAQSWPQREHEALCRSLGLPVEAPTPELPRIVAATIANVDRYRRCFMVELTDGSYHDIGCWYTDERFVSLSEAESLIGNTLQDAETRLHNEDVARIRGWVS